MARVSFLSRDWTGRVSVSRQKRKRGASEETPPSSQDLFYTQIFFFPKWKHLHCLCWSWLVTLIKILIIHKYWQMTVKSEIHLWSHIPEITSIRYASFQILLSMPLSLHLHFSVLWFYCKNGIMPTALHPALKSQFGASFHVCSYNSYLFIILMAA